MLSQAYMLAIYFSWVPEFSQELSRLLNLEVTHVRNDTPKWCLSVLSVRITHQATLPLIPCTTGFAVEKNMIYVKVGPKLKKHTGKILVKSATKI